MGLVIDKAARILRQVSELEPCSLQTLCTHSGYKKPALCMMLQSMAANGLLARLSDGTYYLGPLLFQLNGQTGDESALWARAARRYGRQLSAASGATVSIALLERNKYTRLLPQEEQPVSFRQDLSHPWPIFYRSATGRLLLAQGGAEFQAAVLQEYGLPARSLWPEVGSESDFQRELSRLHSRGYAEVLSADGRILYLGVALKLHPSAPPASLGLGLPAEDFSGARKELLLSALAQVSRNPKVYALRNEKENFFQ
ncbi:MAG: helix-turn-helix domain-containing protein [Lentisphaerae bacterium]|nr:helix-turn-helix domain-containing protein [Lentisphaerota bacterium]